MMTSLISISSFLKFECNRESCYRVTYSNFLLQAFLFFFFLNTMKLCLNKYENEKKFIEIHIRTREFYQTFSLKLQLLITWSPHFVD